MQAASAQTRRSIYLPSREGLTSLLSFRILGSPLWVTTLPEEATHKREAPRNAIRVAGVIAVAVAVVVHIRVVGRRARRRRPKPPVRADQSAQQRNKVYDTKPIRFTLIMCFFYLTEKTREAPRNAIRVGSTIGIRVTVGTNIAVGGRRARRRRSAEALPLCHFLFMMTNRCKRSPPKRH